MSHQLYFSVLRTACAYPIARAELKGNTLTFVYEKGDKGHKDEVELTTDAAKNLDIIIKKAKSL